jgi:hypothetical protein
LPSSVFGAEPSAVGWLAAPGQRAFWYFWRSSKRPFIVFGTSVPPAGVLVNWKALKIGWMRAKCPFAS